MRAVSVLVQGLEVRVEQERRSVQPNEDELGLLVMYCVEEGDGTADVQTISRRVQNILTATDDSKESPFSSKGISRVILLPFSHLSEFASDDLEQILHQTEKLESQIEEFVKVTSIEVDASSALWFNTALIDSRLSSKHFSSRSSLTNHFTSLLRAFSETTIKDALERALEEGNTP